MRRVESVIAEYGFPTALFVLEHDKRLPLRARARMIATPFHEDKRWLYVEAEQFSGCKMFTVETVCAEEFMYTHDDNDAARILKGKLKPMVEALQAYHYSSLWC